jgi:hypothetical protein
MPTLYSGDRPSNLAVGGDTVIRTNTGLSGFETVSSEIRTYSATYPAPTNNGLVLMQFYQAGTLVRVDGVATGGGSMQLQLNKRTNPSTSGTNMLSSTLGISGNATNTVSFSSSSISADHWLYVDLSSKSGTVNFLTITITVQLT